MKKEKRFKNLTNYFKKPYKNDLQLILLKQKPDYGKNTH